MTSPVPAGRCGQRSHGLVIPDEPVRFSFCALPAGHIGWHHADDGTDWGYTDPASPRQQPRRTIAELIGGPRDGTSTECFYGSTAISFGGAADQVTYDLDLETAPSRATARLVFRFRPITQES